MQRRSTRMFCAGTVPRPASCLRLPSIGMSMGRIPSSSMRPSVSIPLPIGGTPRLPRRCPLPARRPTHVRETRPRSVPPSMRPPSG